MTRAPHIVLRLLFELGLRGRDRVAPVQNRVSVFAGGSLHGVMTKALQPVSGSRNYLVIEKIELDLGEISLQNLEEDLAAGIARCLRQWLLRAAPLLATPLLAEPIRPTQSAAGGPSPESHFAARPQPASPLEALPSAGSAGLNAAIASALRGPGDWPQLMATVRDNRAFRSRLASEVSAEGLRGLLHSMVPSHGPWMAGLADALLSLHDLEPLAPVNRNTFRQALWESILDQVARYQPAAFSLSSFIAGVLKLLAARCSIGVSVLTENIAHRAQRIQRPTPALASLAAVLPLARMEMDTPAASSLDWLDSPTALDAPSVEAVQLPGLSPLQPQTVGVSARRVEDLSRFLEWGVLSWTAPRTPGRSVESEMLDLIAASPADAAALVRRMAETQAVRKRIAGEFSENVLHRLLGLLCPAHASWIVRCTRQLSRLHAQKPLMRLENRAFAGLLREFTLEYLAERHWHSFDERSFLRYLLRRLAARRSAGYEMLLADLALRRSAESNRNSATAGDSSQSPLGSVILDLLDEDLLGMQGPLTGQPRFTVQPEFRHLYSDYDVLAWWLRWRRLPPYAAAGSAEEVAQRIGPLLRELPPEIRKVGAQSGKVPAQTRPQTPQESKVQSRISSAAQIERWLLYGIWPAGVGRSESAALVSWLETQDDAGWLQALRRCGAQAHVVQRIVGHLPFDFLLRITTLLAGPAAEPACEYLRSLQAAGRHLAGTVATPWEEQIRCDALIYLLGAAAAPGQPAISLRDFADATLHALSLRRQVSYERLLLSVQRESQGRQAVQDLCGALQEALDQVSPVQHEIDTQTAAASGPGGGPEIVLHYVRYGSLSQDAPPLSLQALRRIAEEFSDQQLAAFAGSALPSLTSNGRALRRMASLLPSRTFVRLMNCLLPHADFVAEVESSLIRLARNLSLEREELLAAGRAILLKQTSSEHGRAVSSKDSLKSLMAALLPRVAQSAGMTAPEALKALIQSSGERSGIANTLAEMQSDVRYRIPASPSRETTRTVPDEEMLHPESDPQSPLESASASPETSADDLQGRVHALDHFLRTGNLPWWAESAALPLSGESLAALLAGEPVTLLQTLRAAARQPGAIERLLQHAPQRELKDIILQAAPEYGGFTILYIQAGAELAAGTELAASHRARAAYLHWRETLQFLLAEHKPETTPAEFLRVVGGRVAKQMGLGITIYVQSLVQIAHRHEKAEPGFVALALMLARMARPTNGNDSQTIEDSTDQQTASESAPAVGSTVSHPVSDDEREARKLLPSAEPPASSRKDDSRKGSAFRQPDSASGPASSDSEASKRAGSEPSALSNDGQISTSADETNFPDEATLLGQLEYFLRYGELPQSIAAQGTQQFMEAVADELRVRPDDYRRYLRKAGNRNMERKRMAASFTPRLLAGVWPLLLPADHAQAALCLELLHTAAAAVTTGGRREQIRQACIEELLISAARSEVRPWDAPSFLRSSVERLVSEHSLRAAVIVEQMRRNLALKSEDLRRHLEPALDRLERETAIIVPRRPGAATKSDPTLPEPRARRVQKTAEPLPAGEPFYIANAGAILLWPFLSRYFQTLGLMEKDAFRGDAERNRGLHLVQYLATGSMEAVEHDLLLNKILCGHPPEQPLELVTAVTEEEAALSTQLLNGVIANWKKLGSTSIDGLRQSFLVREGKLLRKDSDNTWLLTVSTRGYDMLLDSLPWRLSMVRLPWMQALLNVKWR